MKAISSPASLDASPAVAAAGSTQPDPRAAALELHQKLSAVEPACVLFFCGTDYDREALGEALTDLFGETPVIGCTTAGEISPAGMASGSIAGFSLSSEYFVVETAVVKNLATFTDSDAKGLVEGMLQRLERRAIAPLNHNSFALTLLDGMSIKEELVLRVLNDALAGIPLVGGSAGDYLRYSDTHVYYEHHFYSDAAVIVLVNTPCPFTIISGHHLHPGPEKLVVTRSDPAKRVVHELNAEPAALEYCRLMGLSLDALDTQSFALHPLSVQVGENHFVRSIQRVNDDLSLTFFCAIDDGVVLTRMSDGGLVEEFEQCMGEVLEEIGEPQIVIGCDCIHRCIEAESKGVKEPLSELYQRFRVIGFNTYGEHCNALHVNHTFTGVAIGAPYRYPV